MLSTLPILALRGNQIQDLTPIAGLIHLELLTLDRNPVSDISPLENLVNLKLLRLTRTGISDISPLANLTNLEKLWINQTPVEDFTPLMGLNLIEFVYDQACEIPPQLPSAKERIESRTFPSIFQPWDDMPLGLTISLGNNAMSYMICIGAQDLIVSIGILHQMQPTEGLSTSLTGNIAQAHEVRQTTTLPKP